MESMSSPLGSEWTLVQLGRQWFDRAVATPARITVIYLVFGLLALFLSDILLVWFFEDPLLAQVQIVKGALEVLLTGGLIYLLTTASRSSLERLSEERKRQREELSVLHRVLRHNLRNDINLVHGHARDVAEESTEPSIKERARIIREKTGEMLQYTTRAGRLRQINATEGSGRTIDLPTTVASVVAENDDLQSPAVEIRTDLPEGCPAVANHMLGTALSELLTNAVEHHDGDSPTIEITLREDGHRPGFAELVVADDGPGMPEMVVEAVSESGPDQLVHLDGMGLWFVYLTVRESGGDVSIDTDAEGTTVRLHIPRPGRTLLSRPRSMLPGG
jgi:signal transduction histidine kinase